jgi:hypothetical protein
MTPLRQIERNQYLCGKIVVNAEGIESALKPPTKTLVEHSWQTYSR